jgi:hypothetical protein
MTNNQGNSEQATPSPEAHLRVKPLEWKYGILDDVIEARHPFGSYACPKFHDAWDLLRDGRHFHPKIHGVIQTYPTLEAAQAAAQEDYEKHVLLMVETPAPETKITGEE